MNNQNGPTEPDRTDNKNSKNIILENKYEFVRNAYRGTGGFRDGYYLVVFPGETMYPERRQLAAYKNYVRPIVDAMVNPIFKKPIERTCKEGVTKLYYDAFLTDCDMGGRGLDAFMKDVAISACRCGMTYLVVDNIPKEQQPKDAATAIAERALPYVYVKEPDKVHDIVYDRFSRITSITFCDAKQMVGSKEEDTYIRWDANESVHFYFKNEGDKKIEVVLTQNIHGLGILPVVSVWAVPYIPKCKEPDSPIYDLARLNCAMFNIDSERREIHRKQGFSLFCYQDDEPATSITVGAGNSFRYSTQANNAPSYASPDPAIAAGMLAESQDIRAELFKIAEQSGVKAVQISNSGIAKEWDFQAYGFVLANVSNFCKVAEDRLSLIFCKYIEGPQAQNIIVVTYPTKFEPKSGEQDLKQITMCNDIGIDSKTAKAELQKAAIRAALPHIEKDKFEIIEQEIDNSINASCD